MEEIEQPPQMPKVEVRYVITQPHPSEEFSRMKANKAVSKAIGKKISRNRYYGATVDDFIYDADDRDVHHDDEIAAFRAPMKPITTLNDYLPNEDEFNWVVVGSKRNRKAKKQRQAAPMVAEKENDSFEVDYDTANNVIICL